MVIDKVHGNKREITLSYTKTGGKVETETSIPIDKNVHRVETGTSIPIDKDVSSYKISNNKNNTRENKRESAHTVSHQENIFKEVFVDGKLSDLQADTIKRQVSNFGVWRDTCKWWALQGYKESSIGRLLEKYEENLSKFEIKSEGVLSEYDKAIALIQNS